MASWITSSLNRKLLLSLLALLLTASLLFLFLFVWLYRAQLERELGDASLRVNRLLQASLENAMLKRDLEGLGGIVRRLGEQDGIRQVMITDPVGQVRFSSAPEPLPRHLALAAGGAPEMQGASHFMVNEQGREVLRSVNPVRNKPACTECHGPVERNPVNGVLFVDYDARTIRDSALASAMLFAGCGALVVLLVVGAGWWLMRRNVLSPVGELTSASLALAAGRLDARASVRSGDELGRLAQAFNDMAQRLQASLRRIREHDNYLQALIDAVPDGIRVIDGDFRVRQANRAFCEQQGLPPEQVAGEACYRVSHARSEPCPTTLVRCPLHELRNGEGLLKTVHQHVREDGSVLPVEVVAAPVKLNLDGEEQSLVVESVRDLGRQLQISQEQRLAEIDQLANGVAHEIRNPLASIRLALQASLRARGQEGEGLRQLYDYLEIMDGEIDRCIEVTERLLKLSVPPDERRQLVELNTVVAETLSLLAYEAERQRITVVTDLDPANPRVIADDSEMRMLILNLAQNAFHAMAGGGRLRASTRAAEGRIVIGVEDDGVGIPPENLARIYHPFFSRRADGVAGTGLGLTICKAIVERYGGRIDVASRLGQGTRFKVTLPDADAPPDHPNPGCGDADHPGD